MLVIMFKLIWIIYVLNDRVINLYRITHVMHQYPMFKWLYFTTTVTFIRVKLYMLIPAKLCNLHLSYSHRYNAMSYRQKLNVSHSIQLLSDRIKPQSEFIYQLTCSRESIKIVCIFKTSFVYFAAFKMQKSVY